MIYRIFIFLVCILNLPHLFAVSGAWIGSGGDGGDGTWNNASHWNPGGGPSDWPAGEETATFNNNGPGTVEWSSEDALTIGADSSTGIEFACVEGSEYTIRTTTEAGATINIGGKVESIADGQTGFLAFASNPETGGVTLGSEHIFSSPGDHSADIDIAADFSSSNGINVGTNTFLSVGDGDNFSLSGNISVGSGSELVLQGNATFASVDAITVSSGGRLTAANTSTYPNDISGTGTVVVEDGNTLTLSGTSDVAAGFEIDSGCTLAIEPSSLSTANYSGDITGDGAVTLSAANSSQITFSGDNDYTGGTTVNLTLGAGGLYGTVDSLQGDITIEAGATVRFTDDSDGAFTGAFLGTGSVLQTGSATVTLSGTSSFAGFIGATAGTIELASGSSFADADLLISNGTAKGASSVNNITMQGGGGTLAPGNSIGTLAVGGNYSQGSGATLEIEINAAGQTDLLDITGTATITSGAILDFKPEAGTNYVDGTSYEFLTADGGGVQDNWTKTETLTGTNITGWSVSVTDTTATITITASGGGGGSAAALSTYMLPITRNLNEMVSMLQQDNVNSRINQYILKSYPCYSGKCSKKKHNQSANNTKANSCQDGCASGDRIITPFIQFGYLTTRFKPTDNNPAQKLQVYAPFIGVEITPIKSLLMGAGFNYDNSNTQDLLKRGSINANTYGFSVYTEYMPIRWVGFGLSMTTGWTDYEIAHKTDNGSKAMATPDGWFVSAEFSYNPVMCFKRHFVELIARARYNHLQVNPYTEKNSTTRNVVNYDGVNSFNGEFGASYSPQFYTGCSRLLPQVSITQIVPFNSSERQVFVKDYANTAQEYTTIDNTNLYITRFLLGFNYFLKERLNAYANGAYLLNSGMKNSFEVIGGVAFTF